MNKKVMMFLVMLALLAIPRLSQAEDVKVGDILSKIPALKQGVAFDISESEFNYISTINVLQYKDFGLGAGYATDDKAVVTLNYNLGGLKKIGIDTPITNFIDITVGMYAGYGRVTGSNEFSLGPSLTIIDVKF